METKSNAFKKDIIKSDSEALSDLAKIIKAFKRKYDFIEAYLSITGTVTVNLHSSMNIKCNTELDKFTYSKIKDIRYKLYEQLRSYLESNNIHKELIVRDAAKTSWAYGGTELVFETTIEC